MKKLCDPLSSDEAPARTPNRRVARGAAAGKPGRGTRGSPGVMEPAPEGEAFTLAVAVPVQMKTGAKVKLQLGQKNNAEVVEFARAHEQAIATNGHFPLPVPLPEVFHDKRVELEQAMQAYAHMRLALQAMGERRDRIREEFDALFNQRGA
ncbi:hypothetical protein SAMN02745166_01419 [Prosthecobacter debontii]|uniref:Uncharacterized protein n=1 Tax=Prosthecobacter debontii TaxID=48467 RepID=A0A1T4XH80_9BACT|nr:hypothetical protein [Prosthecobacter debontii]SKA88451.1 hypothetical protein SAMN02745166_01419 [Prosthecobacter debontii]